jgi:hypothetical protein
MKIKTAIAKLLELQAKSPDGEVSIKRLKPRKKKKLPKRMLTATLRAWAHKRSENGGSFTFLEACRYYERIGGSAGTTTVWHRLTDIEARNVTSGLAETHLRARWSCEKGVTTGPVRDIIIQDPTFKERYLQARREVVARGELAPAPFDEVTFEKSHGKKGEVWVQVSDTDRSRQVRLQVKPRAGYVAPPSDN